MNQAQYTWHSGKASLVGRSTRLSGTTPAGRTREAEGATGARGGENVTRDNERHGAKTGSPPEETRKDYCILFCKDFGSEELSTIIALMIFM